MAQLGLEVVGFGPRSQLDLLDVHRVLPLLRLLGPLLLLVLVLAPVHDAADGRPRGRRDLYQVQALLTGVVAGYFDGDDADLFAVGVDEADGADADLIVYSRSRAGYDLLLVGVGFGGTRPPLFTLHRYRKIGSDRTPEDPKRAAERVLDDLRARAGAGSPLVAFADAVLAQAGRPLGAAPDPAREERVADALARLLDLARERDAPAAAAVPVLLADPLLLAACFQNVDLLYDAGAPQGDRVGDWVMAALESVSGGRGVHGVLETCLYAVDLEDTARFYERVIGLAVNSRVPDRHVFFRCGDSMLLLFDPRRTGDSEGDVPPHGASGPGHVAFAVGEDELDAWRERLGAAGVEVEREVSWPAGGRSIYIRDPAGNSVELATPSIWGLP